jgi:hypothetical protein
MIALVAFASLPGVGFRISSDRTATRPHPIVSRQAGDKRAIVAFRKRRVGIIGCRQPLLRFDRHECICTARSCRDRIASLRAMSYKNPKVDALIDEAKQNFDTAKQDKLLAPAHSLIIDDAVLV